MFKYLLGLSALFVAFCGGFFSVKGIGLLFSGSFWAAIIMAGSLEFGKIMATSFLYRYWEKINKILKVYLISAVIILMGITSLGIFGFLSEAFYATKSNVEAIEAQTSLLLSKKESLKLQVASNNERINTLIETRKNQESNLTKALDQSVTSTVTRSGGLFGGDTKDTVVDKKSVELKAQTLSTMQSNITSLEDNIQKINIVNQDLNNQINQLDNEIIELKKKIISSDIGTYKFIAQAFNVSIEAVVKWFIFIIVIVFDPLAIALILAYNIVAGKKKIIENNIKIEQNINKPKEVNKDNVLEKIYDNFQRQFKRGTKITHNEPLHDPNLDQNRK